MDYRIEYIIDNYTNSHYKFVQATDTKNAVEEFKKLITEQLPIEKINILNTSLVREQNEKIIIVDT